MCVELSLGYAVLATETGCVVLGLLMTLTGDIGGTFC